MRKVLSFLLFLSVFGLGHQSFAQSKILSNDTKWAMQSIPAKSLNLFIENREKDSLLDNVVNNGKVLILNKEHLNFIHTNKPQTVSFSLVLNNQERIINLERYDIFSSDFKSNRKIEQNKLISTEKPDGTFYRGYVSGDDYSLVALSFYKDEMGGVISLYNDPGNYNIVLNQANPGVRNENYLLFKDVDIINGANYAPFCQNGIEETFSYKSTASRGMGVTGENDLSCKTVTMALYGDYLLYQKNNSSLSSAQNYMTTLFNGIGALYQNDGIRVALKLVEISEAPDNYPTANSSQVLYRFGNDIATNTTADLMQMITGYTTSSGHPPLGGLAWLDVLCQTPLYSNPRKTYFGPFSMVNTKGLANFPNVPVYSWDIQCSTHEFGHNLGSPHTHSCVWNGNNTAIDGCAPTYNSTYKDGNCAIGPIPTKGTIMSYCHLLSNVGIGLSNGFGPQPASLIRDVIANYAPCLSQSNLPNKIVDIPSKTIFSNSFCLNGNDLYCYDNKKDFNRFNDELVMIISNPNIANLDLGNLEISMTTTDSYGSNHAVNAKDAPYLNGNTTKWFHGNRSWNIELNQTLSGTTKLSFPFIGQDKTDLNGSYPFMFNEEENMKLLVITNKPAAQNPLIANTNDVILYPNGNGSQNWQLSSNANYNLGEVTLNNQDFFGALFVTGNQPVGLNNIINSKLLQVYPNPVSETLNINASALDKKIEKIEIIDYLGRNLKVIDPKSMQININTSALSKGMYILKCYTSDAVYIQKFSKL
ncbi:MAG TPA: M12 family metallo-peptidase [Edaphocola sp.]|nr:M12 family metallo-peptidase [Edaphocola sp.]